MEAARYSIGLDFGSDPNPDYMDLSPYWVICAIRQGTLLSYSRRLGKSIYNNLANDPVLNTTSPIIISDDCLNISVNNNKRSPIPTLSATLKQSDTNYLTKIYPGDYLFCWMVYGEEKYQELLNRIKKLEQCNKWLDGLKFIGRVEDIRKSLKIIDSNSGKKTASYQLNAIGFSELQTYFFYDYSLASNDAQEQSLGAWMARLGVDFARLFGTEAADIKQNNINTIIPTLINLLIGTGPSKAGNISIPGFGGESVTATPTLDSEAPYAYVIPLTVGKLLGKDTVQPGKPNVLSYADVLEVIIGVQKYSNKSGIGIFTPELDSNSTPRNKKTPIPLLGTFLPYMPEFTNIPLWDLLRRYLNPAINEMYTTLRVNSDGDVVPTIICRQIPFTTEAFKDTSGTTVGENYLQITPINTTKFLSLPRWLIPDAFIIGCDVGMSNSTRVNFVHIYGSSALAQNNVGVNEQIVVNPPIRDDLDIQRSGLHPAMQTVDCFVSDQVGRTPNQWMRLVADWSIGSQYTLNGSLETFGIQSPIPVGDNLEFEGVVYHIEGVSHSCGIQNGVKFWRTNLHLSNGMRANGMVDNLDEFADSSLEMPIYPAMVTGDNTRLDPGLSLEGDRTINVPTDVVQTQKQIFTPDPFKSSTAIQQELEELL